MCETSAQSKVVITSIHAKIKGITQIRTQIKIVSVGQRKLEMILEEEGDIHIKGNRIYKVWSMKSSSKQMPRNWFDPN